MTERVPRIIVTGAAGGMGSAAVRLLAERGANVLCVDREAAALDFLVRSIGDRPDRVEAWVADVGDESDVRRCVGRAVELWGGLDGVFNIAAILGPVGDFVSTPTEVFDDVIRIDARGVWLSMKYAIPPMIAGGGGAIVNVGSYAAIRAGPFIAAYAAAKHAVVGLTQTIAVEYATQGIRANVLCPGSMDTPMIRNMFPAHGKGDAAQGERMVLGRIPQRRLAQPDELAATGVWLLLDAPTHLSGQTIAVDGARSAS